MQNMQTKIYETNDKYWPLNKDEHTLFWFQCARLLFHSSI